MGVEIPEHVEADDVAQLYFDDPGLQRLIDAAIDQTLEIVAGQLGVKRYEAGDGSEDFWGDVGGSVVNIFQEAGIEEHPKQKLFTASPKLLKACRKAAALLEYLPEDYAEVESDLYDAIAEAEGR